MAKILTFLLATFASWSLVPVTAAEPGKAPWDDLACGADRHEHHEFAEPSNRRLRVHVDLLCDVQGSEEATIFPTDCSSTDYVALSYRWTSPYSFRVDASKSGVNAAGALASLAASAMSWDAETNASLVGSVDAGGTGGKAGRFDGANQVGWKRLGTRTIAQTTTWYSTATFVAVESDQAYSTNYKWSLIGEANRMDVQNIATHEIGHAFGLGHPADTAANQCLTMYAYGAAGETQKRTLGDGDILGIRAIYGA